MSLEAYIQNCFAESLTGFIEVDPKDVIVGPQGPNGQYDCTVRSTEHTTSDIAGGSFYGDESSGAMCITMVRTPVTGHAYFPHRWRHFFGADMVS